MNNRLKNKIYKAAVALYLAEKNYIESKRRFDSICEIVFKQSKVRSTKGKLAIGTQQQSLRSN